MDEQDEFITPQYERLLSIATWARYLAWVVLVVYILWAGIQLIQIILLRDSENFIGQTSQNS